MENKQRAFVAVTMHTESYPDINEGINRTGVTLEELSIIDPKEAYLLLVIRALSCHHEGLEIKVNNKVLPNYKQDTRFIEQRKENLPDVDILPIHVLVSVWKRPDFREFTISKSFKRIPRAKFNFNTQPSYLAF